MPVADRPGLLQTFAPGRHRTRDMMPDSSPGFTLVLQVQRTISLTRRGQKGGWYGDKDRRAPLSDRAESDDLPRCTTDRKLGPGGTAFGSMDRAPHDRDRRR